MVINRENYDLRGIGKKEIESLEIKDIKFMHDTIKKLTPEQKCDIVEEIKEIDDQFENDALIDLHFMIEDVTKNQ